MRASLTTLVKCLLAGIICVFAARLAFVASQTESGWQSVATQWRDAAFDWTGLLGDPIDEREPIAQARFWISEVDRVTKLYPDSATILMGAAWMLDSPNLGFLQHHMRQSEHASAFPQFRLQLDEKSISAGKAEFRALCQERCLALAARATELEPANPQWWRMRAMLLFEGDHYYSGKDFSPRSSNWLEVLDDCITHDEDNALYDYLAALALWEQSADFILPEDAQEDRWVLNITDSKRFTQGTDRLLQAQGRTSLVIGEAGYSAIADFLSRCRLSKNAQSSAAVSRLVTLRHSIMYFRLCRWQLRRADAASEAGDTSLALRALRQNLRLCDQAIIPAETSALNTLTTFVGMRTSTYDAIKSIDQHSPGSVSDADLSSMRDREEELRIESATLLTALQELKDNSYPKAEDFSVPQIVSSDSSAASALLLLVGLLLIVIARLLSPDNQRTVKIGVVRYAIVWVIGCGGTYVVFGLSPAEVISREAQTRAIIAAVWIVVACLSATAVWFVVTLMRRRIIRYRLVTMFAFTTAVAVLASLWPMMKAIFFHVAGSPSDWWIPARGWSGLDAEVLCTALNLSVGTWQWATMQWYAYHGLYVGILISLVWGGSWAMWLTARQAGANVLSYWTRPVGQRWASLCCSVGRQAFTASVCFLLIYFVAAPKFLREAEALYQYQMRYCRDPIAHYSEIREAQAAVKSSGKAMALIREHVEFELGAEAVLERDFDAE
jgi:hypothetical protein